MTHFPYRQLLFAAFAGLTIFTGGALFAEKAPPLVTLDEAWVSKLTPEDNVDSVAFWQGAGENLVVATTKETHQLMVYDAGSGELLRRIGQKGPAPGQFSRPNGIMIVDDLAFVTERDNHRVQVLRLPGLESLGSLGEEQLRRPYGLTLFPAKGGYELYVTDNYETAEGGIPPLKELGQRVVHFRVVISGRELSAKHVRSFGETSGPGALRKVETLLADPERKRLWIADELKGQQRFKVYSLKGDFLDEEVGIGHFLYEPEGLALWKCGKKGYWIATDQGPDRSYFRVYDRRSSRLLGTFIGKLTANTDGVGLTQEKTSRFPAGAFYAVHDDQAVAAFDWRDIAKALGLEESCGAP